MRGFSGAAGALRRAKHVAIVQASFPPTAGAPGHRARGSTEPLRSDHDRPPRRRDPRRPAGIGAGRDTRVDGGALRRLRAAPGSRCAMPRAREIAPRVPQESSCATQTILALPTIRYAHDSLPTCGSSPRTRGCHGAILPTAHSNIMRKSSAIPICYPATGESALPQKRNFCSNGSKNKINQMNWSFRTWRWRVFWKACFFCCGNRPGRVVNFEPSEGTGRKPDAGSRSTFGSGGRATNIRSGSRVLTVACGA